MENPATAGFWLSPQQRRIWALQQKGCAYRGSCFVLIEGAVSADDMGRCLRRLVERHEILRTVYRHQAGMKFPFQVVLDTVDPSFEAVDLRALSQSEQCGRLEKYLQDEQVRSVGPEEGPLLTAKFATLGTNWSALVLSVPAMSADRSSLQVLLRGLEQFVTGSALASTEEPLRYVQFAQWQNDLAEGQDETSSKGREFWTSIGEADRALVLPNETKREVDFSPQLITEPLDGATWTAFTSLAGKVESETGEFLLAAWQSLLWRFTGLSTFRVGVAFNGREYDELRDIVGPIEKMVPIESRFDGDFRFREVLEHVRNAKSAATEWYEHYVPGTGFGSELPVSFEFVTPAAQTSASPSFSVKQISTGNDSFRLKLSAVQSADGLTLQFSYDSSRFTRESIEHMAGCFQTLLAAAVADPEMRVSRLPLLPRAEQIRLISDWNQTAVEYPHDKCLHELFQAQAALVPDRPALRFNDVVLSYRELNERANQMAHYLQSLGVGPDSLVGLCVERSAEMMVAVLGILKAGGAYVPLNPDNPKPRLTQQLAGAVVLITEQALLGHMPEFAGKTLCLDRDEHLWLTLPRTNPASQTTPENLVYVIYTSGSTGVPKGVAVRHRNLVNYSHFITKRLGLDQHSEGLHFGTVSTIGADLGNTCIYPALISGGCLHVISYDVSTDPRNFARYNGRFPIDVLKIVPSHLQALLQSAAATQVLPRKFLILGGETLTPNLLKTIQGLDACCEVFNHYGPTETTVGSLTLRLTDYDWKNSSCASVPIGRPIANTQVYILDALEQPVPTGVVGELYIAGAGVTAGYLNQAESTAERFVYNRFVDDASARMYRTGDLARYLPDGNVEFLGRSDDQVKIRGFRIELGEIETVLAKRRGVRQVVVLAKEDQRGEKRLLAYVVADREQRNSPEELRAYLKEELPDFMVPSAIVLLPKVPLTANGKVDRQALPEPEAIESKVFIAPQTPTEESVSRIWAEVLRRDRVSTDDNFFDLGGHSLLATQVISRVREKFSIELPIRSLFDRPTIAGLSELIANTDHALVESKAPPIMRVAREQYRSNRS